MSDTVPEGTLYVVATPIGNLEDLSERAIRVLGEADVICCEDTRHTRQLLAAKKIAARRLVSLHEHNEASRIDFVLGFLASGASVAIVSDAGTPLLSDPGGRLVAACAEAGVDIVAVPGASALLSALVVAGFDLERFAFEGFLPRKGTPRADRLAAIACSDVPVVCYESPRRVGQTLLELGQVCGDERKVSVSRELTKVHEETWRGTLAESLASPAVVIARGEYVIVIDAAAASERADTASLPPLFAQLYAAGLARRDAISAVELLLGVAHRDAYGAAHAVPLPASGGPPP